MSYDLLFRRAIEQHQNGQLDEAESIYRRILETAPQQPDVLNLLGLIAQAKSIHTEAVSLFYQAIKNAPERAAFHFNLGISLNYWQKPYEALEAFQKSFQLNPQLKEAQLQIGNIYTDLGQTTAARQAYQSALQLDPQYAEAQTRLAVSFATENLQQSINQLQQISLDFPNEALANYFLARLYLQQNQLSLALASAQEAQTRTTDNDEIQSLLGQIHLLSSNKSVAYQHFGQALRLNSHNLDALINQANLETERQNFTLAEKYYQTAAELAPSNADVHLNYANLLYLQHRLSEALETYRQVVIINPKIAEASNNLAIILKDLGEYEEALGLFFNALALKPSLIEISINLAETLTLYYTKDASKAQQIAQNWLKQAPKNPFAQHTAAALSGQNDAQNPEYARELFDHFAAQYEQTLQKISYSLPQIIKKHLGSPSGHILDLGCGSGLLAKALKSDNNRFTGVDISAQMLKLAADKNIYEQLLHSDLIDYLQSPHPDFEFITAADVFCYFGDLAPLLTACAPTPLCFSIENGSTDFQISPSGRYQHSPTYIKNLLSKFGYTSTQTFEAIIRCENGQDVTGTIFISN